MVIEEEEMIEKFGLNEFQREAVLYTEGPLLVLAGAGTGKTRVLTSRIAYIIESSKALPSEVLAVTFTNKAAHEMLQRVRSLTHNIAGINMGTFHSIAAKILRTHAEKLNLESNYTIIDSTDQLKLIKDIQKELEIDHSKYAPKLISYMISRWKDSNLLPNEIKSCDIKSQDHAIAKKIYDIYQNKLIKSNMVDFGDLLMYNNKLFFDNPDILSYYQEKFKYILIDEYQDTNPSQYLWARMIASKYKNICCVGDDDQSIYSWRGAEVRNILKFENDFPGAKIVKLERNYRSTNAILITASSLIKNNKNRHSKTLWTESDHGDPVSVISCYNDKEEARYIANMINNLSLSGSVSPSNIAILVRAGFQTRLFEEVFLNQSIGYKIIGGLKFYERQEIKDGLAYIRLVLNHNDDLAFERIINTPKRSIGQTTVNNIRKKAFEESLSMFFAAKKMVEEGEIRGKTSDQIRHFISKIEEWRGDYNFSENHSAITKKMLEESSYIQMWKLEKSEDSRSRIDNLNELIRAVGDFESINQFMEHTSLAIDNDSLLENEDKVNLMTVHAAKGLEFDVVFLPGMEEGVFPHQKSLNDSDESAIEEERRLAYVAITRARKKLIITYAESRRIFYEYVTSVPSRFVQEIPESIVNKSNSFGSQFNSNSNKSYSHFNYGQNKNKTENYASTFRSNENSKLFSSLDKTTKYRPGSRVQHKNFGQGIVIRKNNDTLEIAFDKAGLKTIKQDYISQID